MTTCAVTGEGAFSGNIRIELTSYGTYAVKAADYEGGAFFSENTFNWSVPILPLPPPSEPITDFGSGELYSQSLLAVYGRRRFPVGKPLR